MATPHALRGLKLGTIGIAFGLCFLAAMASQIVLRAPGLSPASLLEWTQLHGGLGWLHIGGWAIALGFRAHFDRVETHDFLRDPKKWGFGTLLLLVAAVSPFMSPRFSHLCHPAVALALAWTLLPMFDRLSASLERRHPNTPSEGSTPDAPNAPAALNTPSIALGTLLSIAAFCLYFIQSARRHAWFGSGGKDLGLFHQSVWLLSRFEAPNNTILGMSAFGDHMEFIDVLAAPLQWMWPSATALLFFQAVLVASAVYPIFRYTEAKLSSRRAAMLIALAYIFNVGPVHAIMFDWNPTTCGVAFLAWAVWYRHVRAWIRFGLSLFLLAIAKENLAIYAACLCLVLALESKRPRFAAGAVALLAWVAIEMWVLFPLFRADGFRHNSYAQLGGLVGILTHPFQAFSLMFEPGAKIDGLLVGFSSVAYVAWLAPRYGILFAPALLERVWSNRPNLWWGYHYGAGAGIIGILAAIDGLGTLSAHAKNKTLVLLAAATVCLSSVLLSAFGHWGGADVFKARLGAFTSPQDRIDTEAVLDTIPGTASVAAQNHLIPHLSARRAIFEIHRPIQADYVALNLSQDAWPYARNYPRELARELLQSARYGVHACQGAAIILRRGASSVECPALSDLGR
ncbi:MAG: DUF2079 domain-containing protein [Deltaproteobacteria bacterium]|nr:DUF2079 domain-containing protein [Deltaproteobacteria bacterium]